uniref:uncharacterized protein LOC122601704 n=1 Tax=Erigeron canadensis TaxID=72917 RepID=UPI001CB8A0DE|nr:uncharacterized protein LOC122601704 [Erigeron canadensis]
MDQTGETDKSKRIRVSWKNLNVVKTFVEACIHEISVNGREGGSLKTISWKTVSDVLKDSHNLIVDRKQMKNHYDYLKGKYGAWLLLRNKTGNKNKHVESLRNTTLPFPDLCAKLFDEAMATGIKSWGPSSNEPMPRDEPHVVEPIVNEEEQDLDILEYTPQPFSTASQSSTSQSSTPQSSAQPKLDKKKKGKEMMAIVEEEIIGVLKIMAGKHHSKDQKFEVPTFDDCLKKLNEIGWEDTDPLYDVPLAIFCEPNDHYRQAWMKMNADKCANWGAISALDGTLVHAIVPINQQTAYRGRGGGRCYQNVLAICDFNMIFTFVWAGWEGIAHDSRILTEVVFNPASGFPFPPPNKYYLCDDAYANTRGFLAPFRNTRYWLADFKRRRALTKEEKFNHAHAQLRNVIERSYGVLKNRFPILSKMAPYKFSTQRNMVIACFAIHNYIRKWKIHDQLFLEEDILANSEVQSEEQVQEQLEENAEEEVDGTQWGTQSTQYMTNFRNEIANRLV